MGQAKGNRASRRRTRSPLPVVAITSAYEMAAVLARHGGILREYARHYLGDEQATEDEVETVVGAAVDWLLAQENPSHEHGMRYATQALYREAQRELQRRELRQRPVDRRLGPLTDAVMRVLDRLGPRSRDTILRVAQGESAEEIARSQNTTPAVVRIRLFRARERALKLLNDGRGSASAVLWLVPHRLRSLTARSLAFLSDHGPSGTLGAAALVPVVACSLLWPFAAPLAPAASPAPPVALHEALGAVLSLVGQPLPPASDPRPSRSPSERAAPSDATSRISQPMPPRTAATETPEDVTLTALAVPANGRPVIVAIGHGNGCDCRVLMQSLDGGATWSSRAGPPTDVNQLAIPPTYPADPRIFAGVDPFTGRSPYLATAFGQDFQRLGHVPPGAVAVSAHFDDGDPRLFSSAATAVWSIAIGQSAGLPHEEVDYSAAATSATAALATPPPTKDGPAVVAWAPALATVPGSTGAPSVNAVLMSCPVTSPCQALGSLPVAPSRLAVQGAQSVVAYTETGAWTSNDGGVSFAPLALPPGASTLYSVVIDQPSGAPWASYARSAGVEDVGRFAVGSGWADMAGDAAVVRSHIGYLVTAGDRVIEAFPDVGYRCRLLSGGPWLPRCPPTTP